MYDILIVGGGPAGMTAAIYARRDGKSVVIIEKSAFGGQMAVSPKVENYPGFTSVSGLELADTMLQQALDLGAEIELAEVQSIEDKTTFKLVHTDSGVFEAKSVILATGVKHRNLGLEGEEELVGAGLSFCAVCDGAFYAGKTVAVVGGGNSALQEAILLSGICEKVLLIHRRQFTAETRLQESVSEKENIFAYNFVVPTAFRCNTDGIVSGLSLKNTETGEAFEVAVDGVFEAVGLEPSNGAFKEAGLNEAGYFKAGEDCRTDVAGIFAAGDCRNKSVRQITTATADGAVAALAACEYVRNSK